VETFLLQKLPSPVLALAMVVVATGLAVGGLALVRRRFGGQVLVEHREVAGYVFAVVGALYGVLLAFVVVVVWEQLEEARSAATEEAAVVEVLHRNVQALGERGVAVQQGIVAYAEAVAGPEWTAMADDQDESPAADAASERLWSAIYAVEPQGAAEASIFDRTVGQLDDLTALRRERLLDSRARVPGGVWGVLLVGAALCVGFAFFTGVASFRVHAMLAGALAATIALALFLVLSIDLPFTGDMGIEPEAMAQVVSEMRAD
jgi:hypothetical protein